MFIGTSDLSFSLGLRGRQNEPALDDAIRKVVEAGKRHNKIVGRPAGSPEQVEQFMKQGFLLFQAPTDLGFMKAGAKRYLEPLEKARSQTEPRALY
jgi:2-keto-3-deoxy-L-rhamnonate aldolase RhmA